MDKHRYWTLILVAFLVTLLLLLFESNSHERFALPQGETTTKIIGGDIVMDPEIQYPFYVKVNGCGGTLVSPRVVLTAYHCKVKPGDLVVVGPENGITKVPWTRSKLEAYGEVRRVEKVINHPKAAQLKPGLKYDFSCLILDKDSTKQPIYIKPQPFAIGAPLTIIGFGKASVTGDLSSMRENSEEKSSLLQTPYYMRKLQGKYLDNATCQKRTAFTGLLENDPSAECVIDIQNENSTCYGDSGGPAFYENANGQKFIYGVVSRSGEDCNRYAKKKSTMIVASVQSVLPWLLKVIANTKT